AAYFEIQQALAADRKPAAAATTVHRLATELSNSSELPEDSQEQLRSIIPAAEHLHHMELADARKAFKTVSHAIVTLATQVRGDAAANTFTHFFCPMVKGGSGDWLQPGGDLLNPYFGSEMLHCGEKVRVFEASAQEPAQKPAETAVPKEATE
ncbi:MAG: DUF3347 domain-containing protein, partial [Planctomycetota bacterium]|nr:DUF3347 domain-containing protein [Planctomycetota bacterium]